MLRLIYISTATQAIDRGELGAILRVSRINNARCDVTGLLLTGGRRFLQTLEGPADAVETTYARIRHDGRHRAPVVLSREQVDARLFGDWAMGCQSSVSSGGTGSIAADVAFRVERIADDRVRAEFYQFAALHAA